MKILVTGGAGFIGSHLTERLLAEGHEVVVMDNFNDYYSPAIKRNSIKNAQKNSKFTLIEMDIQDDLNGVFKKYNFETIVHLAARAGVRPSLVDPLLYHKVNVDGTVNVLECSKTYGVKKFIFGSSSSVYGTNSKVPFNEEDPLTHPVSPYAVTKIAGENLCRVYHHAYGISMLCLRFFTVYGPRQRPEMAIHKFADLIAKEKLVPYYGDGTSSRDYTYYSDIVDGIMSGINKSYDFEIVNLGDSNTVTLREMVNLLEEAIGKKAKLDMLPVQQGDVPITYADITKAGKLLGYKPKVNIKEGIKNFVEWYRIMANSE